MSRRGSGEREEVSAAAGASVRVSGRGTGEREDDAAVGGGGHPMCEGAFGGT